MKIYLEKNGHVRCVDCPGRVVTIGRAETNDIVIDDPRASRLHCRLSDTGEGLLVLEDLDSRNGTLLRGKPVTRDSIGPGEHFRIGRTRIHLERPPPAAAAAAVHDPRAEATETAAGGSAEETFPVAAEGEASHERSPPPAPAMGPAAPPDEDSTPGLEPGELVLEGLEGACAGERAAITRLPFTLGRRADNDLCVDDARASGQHARIVLLEDRLWIEDRQSKNGTFLDGQRLDGRSPLRSRARIRIGESHFRLQVRDGALRWVRRQDRPSVSEDDLRQVDARKLLRLSRSRREPLVVAGVLLMLGAFLWFAIDVTRRFVITRETDPPPPANALAANWSFELAPADDGAIPGWRVVAPPEARGAASLSSREGVEYPGAHALLLRARSAPTSLVRLVYAEALPVSEGVPFFVSATVLNRDALAAGVLVRWLRSGAGSPEAEVSRCYVNAALRPGEATAEGGWFEAPISAAYAEVSCFVVGGSAAFDRVFFGSTAPANPAIAAGARRAPAPGNGPADADAEANADGDAEANANASRGASIALAAGLPDGAVPSRARAARDGTATIRATLEADGTLSVVRRGPLPRVAELWCGLLPERDPFGFGPRLAPQVATVAATPVERPQRLFAPLLDLRQGAWRTLELVADDRGPSIRLRYTLAEEEGGPLAIYLRLPAAAVPLAAYGGGATVALPAAGPTAVAVDDLVVGSANDRVVVSFAPALRLAWWNPADRTLAALVAFPAAEPALGAVDVTLGAWSVREAAVADARIEDARRLHAGGEVAAAWQQLAEVEAAFPTLATRLDEIAGLRRRWQAATERVLEELDADLTLLAAFPSSLLFENIAARGQREARRLAGTRGGEGVAARLERAQEAWAAVARTRRRDRQAELLRRAEEAFAQGWVHVAAFLIEGLRGLEPVADADLGARVADLATLVEKRKHRLATQDRPAKAERR